MVHTTAVPLKLLWSSGDLFNNALGWSLYVDMAEVYSVHVIITMRSPLP
jgi:hypothetical protein